MTRELIGNRLGIDGNAVDVAASVLENAGLITCDGDNIAVISRPGIEKLPYESYEVVKRETDRLMHIAGVKH